MLGSSLCIVHTLLILSAFVTRYDANVSSRV